MLKIASEKAAIYKGLQARFWGAAPASIFQVWQAT